MISRRVFWRWWHLLCLLNKFLWTKTSCFPFSLTRHRHSLVYRVDLGLTWLAPQDNYKTFFLFLCTASRWGHSFGITFFRANHWSQIPFVKFLLFRLIPPNFSKKCLPLFNKDGEKSLAYLFSTSQDTNANIKMNPLKFNQILDLPKNLTLPKIFGIHFQFALCCRTFATIRAGEQIWR